MRKFQEVEKKLPDKRGKGLPYNVRKLMRADEVFFWQSTDCDCVDTENCQNTCCGSITKGKVFINDPFLNQCLVSSVSADSDERVICVPHRNLRAPEDAATKDDSEKADSDVEEEEELIPAKKRICQNVPKVVPYVPMDSLIPKMETDSQLTYVPCSNGVLTVNFFMPECL